MLEYPNTEKTETLVSPGEIRCVPIPDWVAVEPYALQPPDPADAYIGNGLCRLLRDSQVNLTAPQTARFYRDVQRVLTRAGAEQVSHVTIEFDPADQWLEVHFVRVLRGAECIDHAKREAFQIFRRETNLERLVLDGRITAALLIPDVRIGDIVETAITIHGSTPILRGKYSGWATFDVYSPWIETRHRLLRPSERNVSARTFNDSPACEAAITADSQDDLRWRSFGLKRREPEDFVPSWVVTVPAVQFSEFSGWREITDLLASYYSANDLPDSLVAEIDRLAMAHADPAKRAVEWLRMVQCELRYFSLSLGEGGLVPRSLEAIWSSRFGDCKDAAQLYAAGARRMGLDACAALVSTTHGLSLTDYLPAPNLFNHCIVRLRLDGSTFWLDPTMPSQVGSLRTVFQSHIGWALPLAVGGDCLESLGVSEPLHYLNFEEDIRFGPTLESPAEFRRRIEHFSWAADSLRNRIANEGSTIYANEILKELQGIWPTIVESAPAEFHDDSENNCLTAEFTYQIPHCWTRDDETGWLSFKFADTDIVRELGLLKTTSRQEDIHLARPRKVTRYLQMHMPRKWSGEGWSRNQQANNIMFASCLSINGTTTITHTQELAIGAWFIPAADALSYNELVRELRQNEFGIWARERFGKIYPNHGWHIGRRLAFIVAWGILMLLWHLFRY